jgi:acetyl esterase/lipase
MVMKYRHQTPPSFLSRLLQNIMWISGRSRRLEKTIRLKKFVEDPAPVPGHIREICEIEKKEMAGRAVWYLEPKIKSSQKILLYLHGGAYIKNMLSFHWDLIGEISRETGALVVVADYPLAPKATFLDTYSFMESLYQELLMRYPAKDIVLMGDSAGGGLALGFAQKLVQNNKPLPGQLILLSPWLDVTMSHSEIIEIQPKDKMLGVKGLVLCGQAYAGGADPKNSWVSPIYGDLEGLPIISIFMGTHDLLWPDAKKLCTLLEKLGIPYNYFEYPGMFHVWMAITVLNESKIAVRQIGDLIKNSRK